MAAFWKSNGMSYKLCWLNEVFVQRRRVFPDLPGQGLGKKPIHAELYGADAHQTVIWYAHTHILAGFRTIITVVARS